MFDRKVVEDFCEKHNLIISSETINPGDYYIAMRNTVPQLLCCKEVRHGFIVPDDMTSYCFDVCESVKVKIK